MKLIKTLFLTFIAIALSTSSLPAQQWEPYSLLGDLYPSYAIAISHVKVDGSEKDETSLGDPNGVLGIQFVADHPATKVRLEIRCDNSLKLFEPAVIETVVPKPGEEYTIAPLIPFDQTKLASLRQPVTTYVTYSVTIDGQKQPSRIERLRVRSINDCPYSFRDADTDEETPIDFMFAAYVNENHPWIDEILQEALRRNYIDSFVGDRGGPMGVYRQVMAIWRVLQERGIRYSSITAVAPSADGVVSQHVRLLDESIHYTQANCADGSVLFASILRKIGIKPILVVVPGHMFVGFDLDDNGDQQAYLETTLLGVDARSDEIADDNLYKTLLGRDTSLKAQVAVKSFLSALDLGNTAFAESRNRIAGEKQGYALIDIETARELGIVPIMYVNR